MLAALIATTSQTLSACRLPNTRASDVKGEGAACDAGGASKPRPPLHRLNNSEYDVTIRDLLGTKMKFSETFPPDQVEGGFDTAAAAHVMSPTLAESYLDAAKRLAKEYAEEVGAGCRSGGADDAACLDTKLFDVAERAFRRPFASGESARLSTLTQNLRRDGSSAREAFEAGLSSVLVSPQFLFRFNATSSQLPNQDQYALASRLSYFLWSSMPDAELIELAKGGTLKDPAVLRRTASTMVTDAKAAAFIRNFVGQWLGTRQLAKRPPSSALDAAMLTDFQTETLSYVGEFIRKNTNVRELLGGNFTYLNARLAKYYGLPAVPGDFERVELRGAQRHGLLTQGSFLVATSNPESTSPVKRGKWVLDNILCAPPPPPPPGAETSDLQAGGAKLSMRERLAEHSRNSACAGCHTMMDPVGLAFENYDALGAWRESDAAGKIDPSGELPDGRAFASADELIEHLGASPELPRCVVQKLSTYALGRAPSGKEVCVVDSIAKRAEAKEYGFRDMIVDVAVELLAP